VWNTHSSSIKPTKFEREKTAAASNRYLLVPLSHTELRRHQSGTQILAPLKVLNGSFVFLCLRLRGERAEISSLLGFRILLAGIQPVFAGSQFSDHEDFLVECGTRTQLLLARVFT
jgi:hypothetical protein